jgi:hypothetical protein
VTQRCDVVGIPANENGFRDLGGVLDSAGRDEIADVVPIDAFSSGNGNQNQLGHRVHCAVGGDHTLVEFGAKYRQRDIGEFMVWLGENLRRLLAAATVSKLRRKDAAVVFTHTGRPLIVYPVT